MEDKKEKKLEITQQILDEIKNEILQQLKDEQKTREEKERIKRENEEKKYNDYINEMKDSSSPWIEIRGLSYDENKGIKIELDWNDAFINHLKNNGYTGSNDEIIIHRYVAELAYKISEDIKEEDVEYE